MISADLPLSGLTLFFLLGLRHGVEPDHIAAIDGLTLRALDRHEKHAPWTGTLFALGHGVAVGIIALAVSLLAASFRIPDGLAVFLNWLPVVLLLLLGIWNLRALLRPGTYTPTSLRMRLVPARLRERTDMVSTIAIGLVFALVIDTVAHVSAWSVFATHRGGWWAGLFAGLLFSLGMLATTTIDSQLLCRVLRSANAESIALRYRRLVGWFVVILSFAVALHAAGGLLADDWPVLEEWAEWFGVASLALLAVLWWRRRRARAAVATVAAGS
jgi:high-affinity nickel-transport protein